jgi:redox-sensing transcriptional repressor
MHFDPRSVSESTAVRLSVYVRALAVLQAEGVVHVSSDRLARRFDLSSAQIRKDLATFGEFGVRGVGYETASLLRNLQSILGLDRSRRVAIVGAGRLGTALADDPGFGSGGFSVVAVLDLDPARVGSRTRSGIRVAHVDAHPSLAESLAIDIAVLTVPGESAPEAARRCFEAGILAILNFTPARIVPPAGGHVRNVDLRVNLETLSFYIGGSVPLQTDKEESCRRRQPPNRSLPRRTSTRFSSP